MKLKIEEKKKLHKRLVVILDIAISSSEKLIRQTLSLSIIQFVRGIRRMRNVVFAVFVVVEFSVCFSFNWRECAVCTRACICVRKCLTSQVCQVDWRFSRQMRPIVRVCVHRCAAPCAIDKLYIPFSQAWTVQPIGSDKNQGRNCRWSRNRKQKNPRKLKKQKLNTKQCRMVFKSVWLITFCMWCACVASVRCEKWNRKRKKKKKNSFETHNKEFEDEFVFLFNFDSSVECVAAQNPKFKC